MPPGVQAFCEHEVYHVKLRLAPCRLTVIGRRHVDKPHLFAAYAHKEVERGKIFVTAAGVKQPFELSCARCVLAPAHEVKSAHELQARSGVLRKRRFHYIAEHAAVHAPRPVKAIGNFSALEQQICTLISYRSSLFVHHCTSSIYALHYMSTRKPCKAKILVLTY